MSRQVPDFARLGLPRGLPSGALGEREEPTIQRRYSLMGQPLDFATNDSRLLDSADEAFARYPPPSVDAVPLAYYLFVHPAGNVLHGPQPENALPIMRTRGHLVYNTLGEGNTVVADLAGGYAFGFVTDALANQPALIRYHLLQGIGLSMLAVSRGYLGLHAACIRKGGMTIVINGSAGAGKSTTAYACLRRGYRLISEDGLSVQVGPDALRVWGMPWSLHLLPDSTRFFPELADERPILQINGEWKLAIDVEARWPGASLTDAEPGLVVFLDRAWDKNRPAITPVPLDEALSALGLVWPWQVGWSNRLADGLIRLLEGNAFCVRVGGPPDAVVDALDSLRERLGSMRP